jgi:hypothetical protein
MKKINLQNIKDSLTKNELSKIMAGSGNDVNNNNSVAQCYCTFNNNSVINNNNSIESCSCTCK